MKKYFALLSILFISSCSAKDVHYYQSHPKELQEAIQNCPDKQPKLLSCPQLKKIALQFNSLAYQLQASPQEFGQKILFLQQEIARQEEALKNSSAKPELQAQLADNREKLDQFLIMVKLFESPER